MQLCKNIEFVFFTRCLDACSKCLDDADEKSTPCFADCYKKCATECAARGTILHQKDMNLCISMAKGLSKFSCSIMDCFME